MKLLLILALLYVNSFAQDSNGRINYAVKPEYVSVNLAAEYISRGLVLAPEILLPEAELKDVVHIGDLFKVKAVQYADQDKLTIKLAKDVFKKSESSNAPAIPPSTPKVLLPIKLDSYFSCLVQSAPLFKKIFSLKNQEYLQGEEAEELIESINIRLDHDRGLLGQSSIEGALCGRFLGVVAFPKINDLFELKYLSVMEALHREQKSLVLATMVAIFHPDSPVQDKLMLKKLTEYQFGKMYFSKSNAFSLLEVKFDYDSLLREAEVVNEKNGVTIRGSAIDNWSKFEEGINWARKKISL